MSRQKKYKKRKSKAASTPPKDYSVERYGPLILERSGRFLGLRSDWDPHEHEEYIARVREHREPFRQDINAIIKEVSDIAEQNSPLELLAALALHNAFADPETYRETTHEGKESYVEYALSIALSISKPNMESHPSKEVFSRFNDLIAKIFNDVHWFFATEQLEHDDKTKHDLRYLSIMRYLLVRGDSYQDHHLDLVNGLFTPHDEFFLTHYGFRVEDVLRWIERIEDQVQAAFYREATFMSKLVETREIFNRFLDEMGAESFSTMDDCVAAYDALPEVQIKKQELKELGQHVAGLMFEIKANDELPQDFLELISSRFGDNSDFASFPKSPGWPTNDSVIYRRPLISHEGQFYCFLPQMLFRNLITLFEGLIIEKDRSYFEEIYQKARADYLVTQALEHFGRLLPGARVFKNLFYATPNNSKSARAETDGLILFDGNLFIIEGKAGSLSTPARRGAPLSLKRDITELVDKAYEQASRTRRFINENERPRFEHEDGNEALVIEPQTDLKNVYMVNVTMENLGHLSTQLTALKTLDLIKGKDWPWSVMLNDLRVISEISESPSEFLVYLQRRIRANDYPQFDSSDELDFFMYYLRDGLYFEDDRLKGLDHFKPHGYTEDLDRWYDFQAGRVSSGEKPRLEIPLEFQAVISRIELAFKPGFSEVTTALLDFDVAAMQSILDQAGDAKRLCSEDGKDRDLTMVLDRSGLGVTIYFAPGGQRKSMNRASRYCALKMYQWKATKWILLMVDDENDLGCGDFRIFNKEWQHDPRMEAELNSYRTARIEQYRASGQKLGRNDPCPCNSGLKFKKCCGKHS